MGWVHQNIAAAWGLSRRFELSSAESVLAYCWQIRATAVRDFCCHTYALAQRGLRGNSLGNRPFLTLMPYHCVVDQSPGDALIQKRAL